MLELPVMVPGVGGMLFMVTPKVLAEEEPQELFAITEIFPLVVPAIVVIELVVELPVQPEGKAQVYVDAPLTAGIK